MIARESFLMESYRRVVIDLLTDNPRSPLTDEDFKKACDRLPPLVAAPTAKSRDSIRQELWAKVYAALQEESCRHAIFSTPKGGADKAIEEFDERFPEVCGPGKIGGTL